MAKLKSCELQEGEKYHKNTLYKVSGNQTVVFKEEHTDTGVCDVVRLHYILAEDLYAIYAHEYIGSGVPKGNRKSTDILSCIVNSSNNKIDTLICDVKRNISSFSDDLNDISKVQSALMTAIKNVKKFTEQVETEIECKNDLLMEYQKKGYVEECEMLGLVTSNFEADKFVNAADCLDKLLNDEHKFINPLVSLSLKRNLLSYSPFVQKLKLFSVRKILMGGRKADFQVYIMEKDSLGNFYYEFELVY